jgi:hypothetical protein
MGSELVAAEASWLEMVKSASNTQQHRDEKQQVYPRIVYPTWFDKIEELNDESNAESGTLDLLKPVSLKSSEGVTSAESKEQVLFTELKKIIQQPEIGSKQEFLGRLGSYLRSFTAKGDESNPSKLEMVAGTKSNGVSEGEDEVSTLALLRKHSKKLGQTLTSLILECSLSLRYLAPVQMLLQSKVVVSQSSSRLLETLVEEEKPDLLCLYIDNVADPSPTDVYTLLTYFLDNIRSPSRSFGPVRKWWKRRASEAMGKVVEFRKGTEDITSKSMYITTEGSRDHDAVVSSAIGMAMAVDGFSTAELCIHHLLAAGPDETVVSSVVSQLSTGEVLNLTRYLSSWIHCYSSHLENYPMPDGGRVPSFTQILGWVAVVLEAHFTKIVLSSDFHNELKTMREKVHSLADFGASMYPLRGVTEHIRHHGLLPTRKQHDGGSSDYVIELLDMS